MEVTEKSHEVDVIFRQEIMEDKGGLRDRIFGEVHIKR